MRWIVTALLVLFCWTARSEAQIGGLGPTPIYVPTQLSCGPAQNFAASTTYYCGPGTIDTTDGGSPSTSPLVCANPFAVWRVHVIGTQSSAQTSALSLRVLTTDYTLTGTLSTSTNSPQGAIVTSGLPTSIGPLTTLQAKLVTGAWTPTIPTATTMSVTVFCRVQ